MFVESFTGRHLEQTLLPSPGRDKNEHKGLFIKTSKPVYSLIVLKRNNKHGVPEALKRHESGKREKCGVWSDRQWTTPKAVCLNTLERQNSRATVAVVSLLITVTGTVERLYCTV